MLVYMHLVIRGFWPPFCPNSQRFVAALSRTPSLRVKLGNQIFLNTWRCHGFQEQLCIQSTNLFSKPPTPIPEIRKISIKIGSNRHWSWTISTYIMHPHLYIILLNLVEANLCNKNDNNTIIKNKSKFFKN